MPMLTAAEVRASIDAAAGQVLPAIAAAQAAYFAGYGRYAQLLRTHTVTPADGAATAPDNLAARPAYQAENGAVLASLAGLPALMQSCCWCDQYEGPAGAGYVLRMEVILSGRTWQRSVNVGPESWRSTDWADVTAEGG